MVTLHLIVSAQQAPAGSSPPAWVTAAAAVVAATAGVVAAINGSRTLRRAREDSRAKSRPMMIAELEPVPYASGTMKLVVRNAGPTVARDVKVAFDPPIEAPETSESVVPYLVRRYSKLIPTVAPGTRFENTYYIGRPQHGRLVNIEPTPDQVTVHISSMAPDGRRYNEAFPLDVHFIEQSTYTESSADPAVIAKNVRDSVKEISTTLERWRTESV